MMDGKMGLNVKCCLAPDERKRKGKGPWCAFCGAKWDASGAMTVEPWDEVPMPKARKQEAVPEIITVELVATEDSQA